MDRKCQMAKDLWKEMGLRDDDPGFFQFLEGFRSGHAAGERSFLERLNSAFNQSHRDAELAKVNADLVILRADYRLAFVPAEQGE